MSTQFNGFENRDVRALPCVWSLSWPDINTWLGIISVAILDTYFGANKTKIHAFQSDSKACRPRPVGLVELFIAFSSVDEHRVIIVFVHQRENDRRSVTVRSKI